MRRKRKFFKRVLFVLLAVGIGFYMLLPRKKLHKIAPDSACADSYQRFFDRPVIDLRIVFGYKDARPARFVGDRYERNYLVEQLQATCRNGRQDCGFIRDPEDADLLTKEVLGPDGNSKLIELRVTASSTGPDDDANQKDPFQHWKSARAGESFYRGLKEADAVFYDGHSRDGGGPDFTYPLLDKNGRVNYEWYKKSGIGKTMLERSMPDHAPMVKMVGLYSCVSHAIVTARAGSQAAWITYDKLIYFSEALQGLKDSLSALLNAKCEEDFQKALRQRDEYSRLRGFF